MADYATNLQDVGGIDPTGATDCSAALAGLASGHYLVPAGTYLVSAAAVLGPGVLLDCAQGAVFEIVTPGSLNFSLARTPVADDDQQIFDTTGVGYALVPVTGLRYLTPRWFGARGNGKEARDATFTASGTTVTVAAAAFTADMAGGPIELYGGGSSGGGDQISLTTTVAAYVSATQITVAAAPTRSFTGNGVLTWGTFDDRAIIHALAAIHDTRGGRMFVPGGLYLRGVDQPATVKSNTTIEGEGQDVARIKRVRGGKTEMFRPVTGVRGLRAENLALDLNADKDFVTGIEIHAGRKVTLSHLSLISPSTDLLTAGGGVDSWTLYGVYTGSGARDFRVTECYLEGTQIKGAGNGDNAVYENVFLERNVGYNSRNYGISVVSNGTNVTLRCVYVRDNSFVDSESGGIYVGSDHWETPDIFVENLVVSGNTIRGPHANPSNPYLHVRLGRRSVNVRINDNVLYGFGEITATGIQLDRTVDTEYARNVEIAGNTIFDVSSYGITAGCGDELLVARNQLYRTRGIYLANAATGVLRSASLVDNDADGAGVQGLAVWAVNVPRLRITGGTIKDHDTGAGEGAVRIQVEAGKTCDYRVEGVVFADTLGVQRNGLYEIYAYPGTLRRTVTLCDFRGCVDGAITGGNPYDGRGVWRNNQTSAAMDTEPISRLYGTTTWNPASLAAGATQTAVLGVTGAAVGDLVVGASFDADALGTTFRAEVTGANSVTVYHHNPAAAAVDVGSGRLRVSIEKRTRNATFTWNPPSLAAAASQVLDVMLIGALTTDTPTVSFAGNLLGATLSAAVVTPDWVRVTHTNPTGSTVDVAGALMQVRVPLAA